MPMCTCLIIVLGSGNIRVSQISDSNFGEEKRGQFLGATLKSTGDNFLVRRQILNFSYIMTFSLIHRRVPIDA